MTGLELLLVVGGVLAALGAGAAAVATLVARGRRRRNRVVPEVTTNAPAAWAGAHTPEARLHRRLRAAVEAARAVPDPDGALIRARVEVEQAALAVDDHLVALHGLAERERAGRMPAATAAVAAVEEAAARLADAADSARRSGALPAVEQALERAQLVAEARRELEDDPTIVLGGGRAPGRADADRGAEAGRTAEDDGAAGDDEDGPPRTRPATG